MNYDKLNSPSSPRIQKAFQIRSCDRCGAVMAILRTMLNPTTGKTVRMFECTCGERAWSEDR